MKKKKRLRNIVIGEGIPKVCAPLTGKTLEELQTECEMAQNSGANLVEWRVDFFNDALDVNKVVNVLPMLREALGDLPLIFSFRTAEEGGEKNISLEQYVKLNQAVSSTGYIDAMDIELFRGEHVVKELVSVAKQNQVFTIISNHDFEETPALDELVERAEKAIQFGADVPKLAVMPNKEEDILTLLEASLQLKRTYPEEDLIMISMGGLGVISRFSGELFGSVITFASVKNTSAPGQLTVGEMNHILEIIHHHR